LTEGPVVVDTSPLLHLARAGYLSLLTVLSSSIAVPTAVLEEIQVPGKEPSAWEAVRACSWLVAVPAPDLSAAVASLNLGRGEAAVMEWARSRPNALAVLDDARARRGARDLGIAVIGTAGVVVRARREGRIPRVRPVLQELVAGGMYLSRAALAEAIASAGE
jgi:predicted nucleic acid-binding protein